MKKRFQKQLMSALFAVGMAPMATMATLLTYDLDFEFSGATPPEGVTPWISATFDDSFGGANTVRLTMSATNLVDAEFIDDWLFNFNPVLDPTALSFAWVSGETANAVNTGINFLQADGDGKFDIQFDFPPPPGDSASKFTAGETSVYDISYGSAIDVFSFDYQSVQGGGAGTYGSAAHIQGIGPTDDDSGWIGPGNGEDPPSAIPEPSILALFSISLLGMAASAWRRRKI